MPSFLSPLQNYLMQAPAHLLIVGGFLVFLVVMFLLRFLPRAVWRWFRLERILKKLRNLADNTDRAKMLDQIGNIFEDDRRISHLWRQYRETLHEQYEERDGERRVMAVRATVPAELYFNGQTLVESWLGTEFYKHLPGIFTGLGIIGTFSGLISGLKVFQVSENPGIARQSLETLMHAVSHAFIVSAAAITAAMLVTFLEKALVAALLGKVEAIARALDKRFVGGVDEEYLSRLVKASEESASQAKILKDALVKDLGDMLRNLTQSQIDSNQRLHDALVQELNKNSQEQAASISQGIAQSLAQPLDKIAATVEKASGEQGEAAVLMLQRVMERFGADLQKLLGGQIDGLQGLNNQAAQAMENAVTSLNGLVSKLEISGQQSAEAMAKQMTAAVADMKTEISGINGAMRQAVEAITTKVGASQEETDRKLQETLSKVDVTLAALLEKIQASQAGMLQDMKNSQSEMAKTLQGAATGITGGMENMLAKLDATMRGMETSVDRLGGAVTDAIKKMDAGAAELNAAAGRFAEAGQSVSGVLDKSTAVSASFGKASDDVLTSTQMLGEVSNQFRQAAQSVTASLSDYQNQRNLIAQVLEDLKNTIAQAKQEASVTEDVLTRMEDSAQMLANAHVDIDEYLGKVSAVLAQSNQTLTTAMTNASNTFRESVTNTLAKTNHDFHENLSQSVNLLNTAIQELEVTLSSIGTGRK